MEVEVLLEEVGDFQEEVGVFQGEMEGIRVVVEEFQVEVVVT